MALRGRDSPHNLTGPFIRTGLLRLKLFIFSSLRYYRYDHRVGVGFRGVGYFYRFTPISPGSQLLPYGGSSGQLLPSYHLIKFCLGALRAPFTATHAHTTVTAPSAHRPPHTCQSCVQFGSGGDGGSMPATSSGLAPDARATLARPRVDAVKLGMY